MKRVSKEEGPFQWLINLISGPGYPALPTSGDEPPTQSLKEACEQTGIMTYIGEILFATSSKQAGLSWTRDAVDGAEAVLWAMKEQNAEEGKDKCEECLETGLLNWQRMARRLTSQADAKQKSSWFGSRKQESDEERWQREEEQIQQRIQRLKPLLRNRFGQVEVVAPK